MKIRFCGVRGSTPAPGVEFVRVGGHTSCVAVTSSTADRPTLVLDAGTGIRNVSAMLHGEAFRGTLLLSHLHWDHVQGLPFFAAGDRDDADVHLLMPDEGEDAAGVLRRAMSPPHFPIGPEGLRGNWTFGAIGEGEHEVEGFRLRAREIPHKGGRTFGYRVDDGQSSFAYLPDHHPAPGGPAREAALDLARDVDLLVHDAQFLDSEAAVADLYGHATLSQTVALAREAEARQLVLFHHAPSRTDAEIDQLLSGLESDGLEVTLAVEGEERARTSSPGLSSA